MSSTDFHSPIGGRVKRRGPNGKREVLSDVEELSSEAFTESSGTPNSKPSLKRKGQRQPSQPKASNTNSLAWLQGDSESSSDEMPATAPTNDRRKVDGKKAAAPKKMDKADNREEGEVTEDDNATSLRSSGKKRKAGDGPAPALAKTAARSAKQQKTSKTDDVSTKSLSSQKPSSKAKSGASSAFKSTQTPRSSVDKKSSVPKQSADKQIIAEKSSAKKRKADEDPDASSDDERATSSAKKKQKLNEEEDAGNSRSRPARSKLSTPATARKAGVPWKKPVGKSDASSTSTSAIPNPKSATAQSSSSSSSAKLKGPTTVKQFAKGTLLIPGKVKKAPLTKPATASGTSRPSLRQESEPPKKAQSTAPKQKSGSELAPSSKKQPKLPEEYKNESLRADINALCMTKGIGNFEEMKPEQQNRLAKEIKMRSEYLKPLDIFNAAERDLNREKRKAGTSLKNNALLQRHEQELHFLQEFFETSKKALDDWLAKDSRRAYAEAYKATLAGKKQAFLNSTEKEALTRRAAFFAKPLPIEIWEEKRRVPSQSPPSTQTPQKKVGGKRPATSQRRRALSSEPTSPSGWEPKSLPKSTPVALTGADEAKATSSTNKKSLLELKSPTKSTFPPPSQDDRASETPSPLSERAASNAYSERKSNGKTFGHPESLFGSVSPREASDLVSWIPDLIDFVRIESLKDGDQTLVAYTAEGGILEPEDTDPDASDRYFDVLEEAKDAILDSDIKVDGLEKARQRIAELYDLEGKVHDESLVEHAINELPDWKLPEALAEGMKKLGDEDEES